MCPWHICIRFAACKCSQVLHKVVLYNAALQVASEDTVLYTAQRYVDRYTGEQRAHAQQLLAPLIRCPLLSRYWLTASVNSAKADTMLLAELRPHLRELLLLLEAQPSYTVDSTDVQDGGLLAGAPPS